MQLIRIVNAFYAALFPVLAAISLAFLSAARDGFGRGGAGSAAAWAALFLLLGLLAFLNLRRAAEASDRLLALNVTAALPMLVGLAGLDPAGRFLCGASALPFALTSAMILSVRRRKA
jgi:MoxR-like ATPase